MTPEHRDFVRTQVEFYSGDSYCAAWLYLPTDAGGNAVPAVVMGHGMGATREMGLEPFAERFVAAGMAVLVFTYRNFGDSGGKQRQVISVKDQLADWDSALAFVKADKRFDPSRVAVWGTSFGGGHAIAIASRHPELRVAVAQCPFTDGTASAGSLGLIHTLKVLTLVARDYAARLRGGAVTVPIAAPPRQLGLMNSHDALTGYECLLPDGFGWLNYTPARSILNILRYRPGREAKKIRIPILVCVSGTDTVAPPERTLRYVRLAPLGDVRIYEAGHFDFYLGDVQKQLADEQADFLACNLLLSHAVADDHRGDHPDSRGETEK